MVPCVHEALESSDWATRKAAAETLMHIGSTLAPHLLTAFKSPTLLLLESCRFDKVRASWSACKKTCYTLLSSVLDEIGILFKRETHFIRY